MSIPFTQYIMPHGRTEPVTIERPADIEEMAHEIIRKGYVFECEMLSDMASISLTITDPTEGDMDGEVVPNGPDVPRAIDRMVMRFHPLA